MAWALSCGASPGSSHQQTEYHMSYNTLVAKCRLVDSLFFSLPQCLLRSPVHPYPTPGAGELTASVAEHTQSIQDQRHLLLLLRHGALHQRPGHSDGDSEGEAGSILGDFPGIAGIPCNWISLLLCSDISVPTMITTLLWLYIVSLSLAKMSWLTS